MKTNQLILGTIASLLFLSAPARASVEVYKGASEIFDEDTVRTCTLTIERDEKSNILSLKIDAPARLIRQESGEEEAAVEDITPGKEGHDISRTKKFSEFHFQRLADLQGEGFMLHGEKIEKSKKDEKLFLHFDVQEHNLVGVQFEQREARPSANKAKSPGIEKLSLEKICSGLKKL